jgi:hypothetical protein
MTKPCENEKRNQELAQRYYDEAKNVYQNHKTDPLNQNEDFPEKYQQDSQRLEENLEEKENNLNNRIKELEECQNKNRIV